MIPSSSPPDAGDKPEPAEPPGRQPGAARQATAVAEAASTPGVASSTATAEPSPPSPPPPADTSGPHTADDATPWGPAADGGVRDGPPRRSDVAVAAGLGAVALALYASTLLPGVGYSGDTAKWQFLGRVGGTPHATGYPLYLALDKLWVNTFRVGELAWRVNLLSSIFGAATVAVLFLLLRQLGTRRSIAAATVATFAVTYTFWSQAVVAEVYTLHLLLLSTLTLCLARWRYGGSVWWLRAGLAVLALSFGNHLGTSLAVPGVLWVVLSDHRRSVTLRNALWAAGCLAVAVGQYGYLLWMDDVGRYAEYRRLDSWGDIWDMVTGGPFRERMWAFGPGALADARVPMLARLGWEEVSLLAVPALYGVWRALRQVGPRRHVAIGLLLLAAAATAYALEFDVPDVFVFFLPLWLVVAVFLGIGVEGVARAAAPRLHGRVRVAAAAVLVVVPVAMAAANYGRADQSDDVTHARRFERLVDVAGHDALLVTDNYRDSEFVWYYLLGEGLGDERRLRLGNMVAPGRVRRYLDGSGLPGIAPAGLPVYTATPQQARDLRAEGLDVTEVAPGAWRVELPPA